MEFLLEPQIWIGLITLIIIEIVLGIDNLVFIAILVKKLPPEQRDKARTIGLSLALLMRLGLLSIVSWLVTLTQPLFSIYDLSFSTRDLILITGGLFLLFKATHELHERFEGDMHQQQGANVYASFGVIIAQILALDAVFSLDSIITAVGMVDSLTVMMIAVIISMIVMLLASKSITNFVNAHPTVIVLCLSFLLMIGFILVAEGFGFHIPKGYLYAAIGFSILIEMFNQMISSSHAKHAERVPLRQRTTEAIFRLMGNKHYKVNDDDDGSESAPVSFGNAEREMVTGVLSLSERNVRTVMTQRSETVWLNTEDCTDKIKQTIKNSRHQNFPVCSGSLDNLVGIVRSKDLLLGIEAGENLADIAAAFPAYIVPDSINVIRLLDGFRESRAGMAVLADEFGSIQGIVTLHDLLESIVGEFPDIGEIPEISVCNDGWLVKGSTSLHDLESRLETIGLIDKQQEYITVAGLLLALNSTIPKVSDVIEFAKLKFEIVEADDFKVSMVKVSYLDPVS
ncbi:TerC family protein [Shewanella schlegeliana]|uniref:TerC family protein n=1 Tax=Shewanella schlegeliana TaxID=190308 RepID=A0ABS1SYH5_9GAMM|nr:TerC family protein [Shewanella schlegeliana]MBL4912919.1 TerC family protein [Shewanella schlegeliana]MCL1108985.1 TerC family protein [Shewanella schlegeliana]GIU23444.1 membrane protein [Shewanella schlegeliana]